MEAGQRDFVIERLEKQLLQKSEEVEQIKTTLRDSIIRELRDDLRSDLEINNRLIRLEQKVQELTNTVSGVMDELLDQKSMIQKIKTPEREDNTPVEPRPHTGISDNLFVRRTPPQPPVIERIEPEIPPTPEPEEATIPEPEKPRRTMSFNIRDINESVPKSESSVVNEAQDDLLIIPENTTTSRPCNERAGDDCEYIVAEEKSRIRRKQETEFETVENREDEDTVITTTRRK
ncbi:putative coiled-coil protein SlyX [Methanohalophilus levihalophilus]|uniref:hypothetical protein n=1 Tax=Methanohalophilus levihalophilus TaxID=1431282 RepID=UPI001AE92452|nr:hypothetical protein [Methanohalophilus levihalophilus]MBP2030719.1 putative coiled-coil protein SlyX [Methanohalophilus levihalophilus]